MVILDIYVYEFGLDLKVLGYVVVLYKVCLDLIIEDIICFLRIYEDDKKMFNLVKGLYWF